MKTYSDDNFVKIEGWLTMDTNLNMVFPWYTRPFLRYLTQFDISEWKVFEYGGGNSTLWWRKNVREVHSIDTNFEWSQKCNLHLVQTKEDFIKFPLTLIDAEKFDCIIIDGEPTSWRDDCTQYAIQALKDDGKLIIDNYNQKSVGLGNWPKTNQILSTYKKNVFAEPDHVDWKTAVWTRG